MKINPCIKTDKWIKMCEYGGNKRFNYGFFQGTSGYCRLVKKWLHDIEKCPKEE